MTKKNKPTDGLGPYEISKIRSAVRQVWHRSFARKLAVKRVERKQGSNTFYQCELCNEVVPQIKIDHIERVGDVNAGFVKRMFVPSKKLQSICNGCHKIKTKAENDLKKKSR